MKGYFESENKLMKLIRNFEKSLLEIVDDCMSDWSYIEREYHKAFEVLRNDIKELNSQKQSKENKE